MSTHIEFTTIHGEKWIMHKDNVKSINLVNTPNQFIEDWNHDKVVIVTSTEINEADSKPWQFMVSDTYDAIKSMLCFEPQEIELLQGINNLRKAKSL